MVEYFVANEMTSDRNRLSAPVFMNAEKQVA